MKKMMMIFTILSLFTQSFANTGLSNQVSEEIRDQVEELNQMIDLFKDQLNIENQFSITDSGEFMGHNSQKMREVWFRSTVEHQFPFDLRVRIIPPEQNSDEILLALALYRSDKDVRISYTSIKIELKNVDLSEVNLSIQQAIQDLVKVSQDKYYDLAVQVPHYIAESIKGITCFAILFTAFTVIVAPILHVSNKALGWSIAATGVLALAIPLLLYLTKEWQEDIFSEVIEIQN